jgi:hypothetical protein
MKKLDEKRSLLNLSKLLGQTPDPKLLEDIAYLENLEERERQRQADLKIRVGKQALVFTGKLNKRANPVSNLEPTGGMAGSITAQESVETEDYKRLNHYPDGKPIPAALPDLYQSVSNKMVPAGQNCHNCNYMQDNGGCSKWNGAQVRANYWCAKWEKIKKKDLKEEVLITSRPQSVPDQMAQYITRNPIKETVISQGDPVLLDPTNNLQLKVKQLEKWVSKIAATGPGSGSAWLWDLYDVDSGIKTTSVDTQILSYDGALNKWTNKNQLQVDNTSITVSGGVISAQAYYGSFYSTQNLTSLTTSAQTLRINNVDQNNNGVNLNTSTGVFTLVHPGTYNVAFSIQCKNTDTGTADHDVYVWLRQNGADVALTNSVITVPAGHGSLQGYVIAAWNLFLRTTAANETFELRWWTDGPTKVTLETVPAQAATAVTPAMPASPAVILTVNSIKLT